MIVTKTVKIRWSTSNLKLYKDKGYAYTKVGDLFDVKVEDLAKRSAVKVVVKCDDCGKERTIPYTIISVSRFPGHLCNRCANFRTNTKRNMVRMKESFISYCEKNIDQNFIKTYWSEKNVVDPHTVAFKSTQKVWIKCQRLDYHDDYQVVCSDFVAGNRCSQCGNHHFHPKDSLGEYLSNTFGEDFINTRWSKTNKLSPYSYGKSSQKKAWFTCPNNLHEDYEYDICNATRFDFHCPKCSHERKVSYLQEKVETYIQSQYGYPTLHENKCTLSPRNDETGAKLRYDLEIQSLRLVVEIHGEQHYNPITFGSDIRRDIGSETATKRLTKQKERDFIKKQYAINHDYTFLEIPYWTEKDESYKQLIDEAILSAQKAVSACS